MLLAEVADRIVCEFPDRALNDIAHAVFQAGEGMGGGDFSVMAVAERARKLLMDNGPVEKRGFVRVR